jgi:nucleotide-binding universal stress UspA family protein
MYKRALFPLDGSMVAVAFDHHWRRPHNDPEQACQLHVRIGDAVAGILAGARDVEADLIAMTTHGRGGLGRHLERDAANADKGRSRRRKS